MRGRGSAALLLLLSVSASAVGIRRGGVGGGWSGRAAAERLQKAWGGGGAAPAPPSFADARSAAERVQKSWILGVPAAEPHSGEATGPVTLDPEGAQHDENEYPDMGEGEAVSQGMSAEAEARGELADALMAGDTRSPTNVRLFNTLFSSQDSTEMASPDEVGGGHDSLGDSTPDAVGAFPSENAIQNSMAKVTQTQQQLAAVQEQAAQGSSIARAAALGSAAAGFDQYVKTINALKNVSKVVSKAEMKEKEFKKRLANSGQKVLVSEDFIGPTTSGWGAVTMHMKKLPGGLDRNIPVELLEKDKSLSVTDTALKGKVWYWKVPKESSKGKAWLGSMQDAMDGKLIFEMNQSPVGLNEILPSEGNKESTSSRVGAYDTFADIILHGGQGERAKWTLGFYLSRYALTNVQPSSNTWTKYEVPLGPVAGDPVTGNPWVIKTEAFDMDASETHFKDVLGNVDTMLIRGRYQTGTETTKIRNVMIVGCPKRCENGAEVLRDRCVCKCKKGYIGDRCETQASNDFENLGKKGQGSGKCLTLCRPKLKATRSGQVTYLECSQKHNTNFYPSAQPIAMFTPCSGESNQLWHYDGDSKKGDRYRSVALPGFCLAQANAVATKGAADMGFNMPTAPGLSVEMCSNENPANIFKQTPVRSMEKGVDRFSTEVYYKETKTTSTLCIAPHFPWENGCADVQCSMDGSDASIRQAVLKDCDGSSNENRFYFGASRYLAQREEEAKGDKAAAASLVQSADIPREMKIKNAEKDIAAKQAKLQALEAEYAASPDGIAEERIPKAKKALAAAEEDQEKLKSKELAVKKGSSNEYEQKAIKKTDQEKADVQERSVKSSQAAFRTNQTTQSEIAATRTRIALLEGRLGLGSGSGSGSGGGSGDGEGSGSPATTLTVEDRAALETELSELQSKLDRLMGAVGSGSGSATLETNAVLPQFADVDASTLETLQHVELLDEHYD